MKFVYSDLKGLDFNANITRRDPSPVIKIEGKYYFYYSKTPSIDGYDATIWYAVSEDGKSWSEGGMVLDKGEGDAFDAGAVFTPTTLLSNGYVYLFYTGVRADFYNLSLEANGLTAIGLAKSKNPQGPFERVYTEPILRTGISPEFDSHRVDDSCIIAHGGKYYMYYKGRQLHLSPKETKMGLAVADKPEGPYIKYESNPVLDSGHEVCVYPNNGGFMALTTDTGEQGNSYLFSSDGIAFNRLGELIVPQSVGPYREDAYQNDKSFNLSWGVFHDNRDGRPYLRRFDVE